MRKIIKKPGANVPKIPAKVPVKVAPKIATKSSVPTAKRIERGMKSRPVTKSDKVDPKNLIPTGSTTFNLECSGKKEGAFQMGKMVNLIGDSHAGKTLFALTIYAECAIDSRFDNYRFIYDEPEHACEFDIPYLFGDSVADRIETDIRSKTIEDFNDNLARAFKDKRPCIYILDSFDALTSESAIELDIANRKAREKGNKIQGSYGDGKAKTASTMFAQRIEELDNSKSFLMIISQTRDNIGFGAMFTPKTRSGGKALKFYAFHEIWLAMQKKEKEGKRTVVTNVQAKITKNKLTGRHGEAYFPVLFDYGVDNIKSCINFLIDEGGWGGTKAALTTKGFIPYKKDSKGKEKPRSVAETISYIEDHDLEEDLFQICQVAYDEIMEGLKPNRKRKY